LRRKNGCYSEFVVIVNAGHAGLFLNGLAKKTRFLWDVRDVIGRRQEWRKMSK